MDAVELIAKVKELQERYGEHINVLVNHEEILLVAYRPAASDTDGAPLCGEYIDINSYGSD